MAASKPGRGSDQFPLRLPDGMREKIRLSADQNNRSMNAEIVARLELSMAGVSMERPIDEIFRDTVSKLMSAKKPPTERQLIALSAEREAFYYAQTIALKQFFELVTELLREAEGEEPANIAAFEKLQFHPMVNDLRERASYFGYDLVKKSRASKKPDNTGEG